MLSAMLGAPSRTRVLGRGTPYSGSMRSELLIETTVRASTRVAFSAGRGATADASAGAVTRAAATAVGSVCGGADVAVTLEPAATSVGAVLSGAGTTEADCCTTLCSRRVATTGAGAGGAGVDRAAVVW